MAVLTREVILAEIEAGRLVISPFAADQLGAASIDLTLGDEIRVIDAIPTPIDLCNGADYRDHTQIQSLDEPYVLAPGCTIHGITRERISLPPDLCGFLEGRSRFARLGLMIHVRRCRFFHQRSDTSANSSSPHVTPAARSDSAASTFGAVWNGAYSM